MPIKENQPEIIESYMGLSDEALYYLGKLKFAANQRFINGAGKNYINSLIRLFSYGNPPLTSVNHFGSSKEAEQNFKIIYDPPSVPHSPYQLCSASNCSLNTLEDLEEYRSPDNLCGYSTTNLIDGQPECRFSAVLVGEVKRSRYQISTGIKQLVTYAYARSKFTDLILVHKKLILLLICPEYFYLCEFRPGERFENENLIFRDYRVFSGFNVIDFDAHKNFELPKLPCQKILTSLIKN